MSKRAQLSAQQQLRKAGLQKAKRLGHLMVSAERSGGATRERGAGGDRAQEEEEEGRTDKPDLNSSVRRPSSDLCRRRFFVFCRGHGEAKAAALKTLGLPQPRHSIALIIVLYSWFDRDV